MAVTPDNSVFARRYLIWVFVAALGLIALPPTVAQYLGRDLIAKQESNGRLINISGRQRMLSQRILLFANRIADRPDDDAIHNLSSAVDLFERSHAALIEGSDEMGTPPLQSEELRRLFLEPPRELDAQVKAYVSLARQLLGHFDGDPLSPAAFEQTLDNLNVMGQQRLLADLDAAFTAFEDRGDKGILRIQTAQTLTWYADYIVIALVFLIILVPVSRTIRRQVSDLAKTGERLSQASRIARVGHFEWDDATGKASYLSPEYLSIMGIDVSANDADATAAASNPSIGEYIEQHIHPEDIDSYRRVYDRSLIERMPYTVEYRVVLPDGRVRHLLEHCEPMVGSDGQSMSWTGVIQDVTNLRRAEREVLRKEEQLREQVRELRMVEARNTQGARIARIGHFEWNETSSRVSYVSNEYLKITGLDEDRWKDLSLEEWVSQFVHPADRDDVRAAYQQINENPAPYQIDYRIVLPDGCIKYVAEHCERVNDVTVQEDIWVGVLQDVTGLRQAERQLADREAQLHIALDSLPGGLIYTNSDMEIILCSRGFASAYQIPEELLEPGAYYPDVLMYLASNGYYGPGSITKLVNRRHGNPAEPQRRSS